MLNAIMNYPQQLTLAAVIFTAAYQVGYFSKIGIHYLGLTDFSNLAYTFGLTFFAAFIAIGVGAQLYFYLRAVKSSFSKRIFMLLVICSIFALVFVFAFIGDLRQHHVASAAFAIVGLALFLHAVMYSLLYENERFRELGWLLSSLLAIAVVFLYGTASAEYNMYHAKRKYEIKLADGTVFTGKMLRTSSAGIIVFRNGRIVFYPKDELKEVSTNAISTN